MLHFRAEVVASLPGALYSVAKAVPGFLHVSDFWRWLINNAIALFSGLSLKDAPTSRARLKKVVAFAWHDCRRSRTVFPAATL
eukprot:6479838-Amphidinium_carterae.2